MKPIFKIFFCITMLFHGMPERGMSQANEAFVSGIIDFRPNGELSVLKVFCKNHTPASLLLTYELKMDQEISREKEEGDFDVKGRQKYLLALHTFDYNPNQRLSIKLKIFSAGDLLTSDSLVLFPQVKKISPAILDLTNDILTKKKEATVEELLAVNTPSKKIETKKQNTPKKNKLKQKEATVPSAPEPTPTPPPVPPRAVDRVVLPQEEIGIDGLIIDETRSKMAHDFYDLFYRKWITPSGTSDFIIYVKELPSRGRISRVSLLVNEDEVLQRNLSPRYDLLEQQVNLAIRVLTNHLKKKESVKSQLGNEDAMGSGIF